MVESSSKVRRLRVEGSPDFREKVSQALKLIKTAGYYDYLRAYIRCIKEIEGLTQLRVSEATIWANKYAVENPVDAASRFIQEAYYMQMQIEGKYPQLRHEGIAELQSFKKRIEFLRKLREKSRNPEVKNECSKLIEMWGESQLIY